MKAYVENTVNDRQMAPGLSLDSYVSDRSGETVYTVCDHVGLLFTTIFPDQLEPYYESPK